MRHSPPLARLFALLLMSSAGASAQDGFGAPAPAPVASTFRNVTQTLNGGESDDASLGGRSQGLRVRIQVRMPGNPPTDAQPAVMTQALENLRTAINRQCELYVVSFSAGCRVIHVDDRLNARQQRGVEASVSAEFELTAPSDKKTSVQP